MEILVVSLHLFLLFHICLASDIIERITRLNNRATCTVLANGYEVIDDAPAINAAIKSCGDRGTIVLPQNNNYSIHTPLYFQECKHCDFQLEGYLYFTEEHVFSNHTSFNLTGVQGATIRSLTGKGAINGNAVSWWWTRWATDDYSWRPDTFFTITNASDITISNLAIWDVKQRFFRAINSSNLVFSNLRLTANGAWAAYPRDEAETFAIEVGNVTDVSISSIDIKYTPRATHRGRYLGACVAFDHGTRNVLAKDISCIGAWGGVLVMGNTIYSSISRNTDPIQNIYVKNITVDGVYATGFVSSWSDVPVSNVTWDGVTVIHGVPADDHSCYLRLHYSTPWAPQCQAGVKNQWTNIWFKNFNGRLTGIPGSNWGYMNNMSIVEAHFETWVNSTV
jgi:galacturan 1,4-alpha-galacturonidase